MQSNGHTQGLQQALAQLPPPVSPQEISNVPAIGWFLLAALLTALLVALTAVALKRYRIYKRFRPLHLYLRRLHSSLEKQSGMELDECWSRSLLLDLGKLIRKTCMDLNNSKCTQSLTGKPWLEEADRIAARDEKPLLARHSDSFAKLYDQRKINKQELAELLHACQQWISCIETNASHEPAVSSEQVSNGKPAASNHPDKTGKAPGGGLTWIANLVASLAISGLALLIMYNDPKQPYGFYIGCLLCFLGVEMLRRATRRFVNQTLRKRIAIERLKKAAKI